MGAGGTLEFGILGPLSARRDGEALALGGAKQRAVLALLLLNANRFVSTDVLIEELWQGQPPGKAQTAVQGYISALRKLLEPDRAKDEPFRTLVTEAAGYLLRVGPAELDLQRFESLFAEGQGQLDAGNAAAAAMTCRSALELWRGPPLADFTYDAFAQGAANRLEELRLACVETRIEADLACGRHAELVGELEALTAAQPLREGLRGQLMVALYRAGRQAEALDVYQQTRRLLVDELGIEPSPPLQELERRILRQDESLDGPRTATTSRRELPAGRLALFLSDIEGSTRLLQALGERYAEVLAEHRRLLRVALEGNGGQEIDRQGDNLFAVFPEPANALKAAIACQQALAGRSWPGDVRVRVRIGVHVGEPDVFEDGYVGRDVHRAARICDAAHGGQVLLSREAALAADDLPAGTSLRFVGTFELRDLQEPEELSDLVIAGLESEFPPPRVEGPDPEPAAPDRAVLVSSHDQEQLDELVELARPLAVSEHPRELVVARLLAAGDEAALVGEATIGLQEHSARLAAAGITARVVSFTSPDVPADIVRLAARPEVDLLLLGSRPELLRDGSFDAGTMSVLREAPCDVAVWLRRATLDRERWEEGPILVPFGGGAHDWAAIELGAWLARADARPLRVLGTMAGEGDGGRDASRMLADASLLLQRATGVVFEPQLVGPGRDGIVESARGGGLLVVGLSERWAAEGLGMVRWAIANTAKAPTLLVRKGLRPGGLAPGRTLTRFTWSVSGSRAAS